MDENSALLETSGMLTADPHGTIASTSSHDEEGMMHWVPIKIPDAISTRKEYKSDRTCSTTECTETESLLGLTDLDDTLACQLFAFLGFENNPFASGGDIRNTKAADMRLAMLSNFSTAYNVVSISMALEIMHEIYDTSPAEKSLCSSALIAGMIAGQLVGGAVGDILGRHLAMAVVMVLQIVGALATAASFDGVVSIYNSIAFWRFILGVGCGGVYPLAATITAEANAERKESSKAVALAFSMQGAGYFVAPLLTTFLTSILPSSPWLCWRLVLGFGAIPGLWLIALRARTQMMQKKLHASLQMQEKMVLATAREVPASVCDAIAFEKELLRKLLGTAGCWFLFDVLFYGNVLFSPVVFAAAFGSAETARKTAMHTSIVSALAVPGYFMSVIMMGRQSPRFIQGQGFLAMAILYFLIGIFFQQLADHKILLILLYGSTFFFSNYGPNATVSFRFSVNKKRHNLVDKIDAISFFHFRPMFYHLLPFPGPVAQH